tara:strand:- start:1641 stop:2384 length:744 start_codon:yes stop_codon:yes gene_type:complete
MILRIIYNKQFFYKVSKSQNQNLENIFLEKLSDFVDHKRFVEIGFHHNEFNCINLIKKNFEGLMIDGGRHINILMMKIIIFILNKKIEVKKKYLKLNNLISEINQNNIGVLSIDVDGNDYWFLKKIVENKILPEVIIIEYNASFLDRSISVVYDENFDRKKKHQSGFYHGASLSAFYKLLKKYHYHLVKSVGGANAIFVNEKVKNLSKLESHKPESIYEECEFRNHWSNTTAQDQYNQIKHLELIDV